MVDLSSEIQKGIVGLFSYLLLGILFYLVFRKIKPTINQPRNIVVSIIDFLLHNLIKSVKTDLGPHFEKHVGFLIFLFFVVLISNLVGLLPKFPVPSMSPQLVLGLSLLCFIYFNYYGIKELGLKKYLKHMASPLIDLGLPFKIIAIIIFCVELISTCLRVGTLTLRLIVAMFSDHSLLDIFATTNLGMLFGFIPIGFFFYLVGFFISFVQAYVYFILNMLYIQIAVTESDDH